MPKISFAYGVFICSAAVYAYFWAWAMVHAALTPKTEPGQRLLWVGGMLVNPSAAIWYWYIWKRWAFWILFTPYLGIFVSLPVIVRSLLGKAEQTNTTQILFALGSSGALVIIACLLIFPLVLRLVALLHLGRNQEMNALDRNDWVMALALPVFGFGAGFAYCAKYKRAWAMTSLVWWVAIAVSSRYIFINVNNALLTSGEVKREEFRAGIVPPRN